MAKIVLFGAPKGFGDIGISKGDEQLLNLLQTFDSGLVDSGKKRLVRRYGNTMHYIFLVYKNKNSEFFEYQGRAGSFFGIDLILTDQEITNQDQLSKLIMETYNKYVKNHIIQELPDGRLEYMIPKFDDKIWHFVGDGFMDLLRTQPELDIRKSLKPLTQVAPEQQRY